MDFVTADPHFFHENIIKYCKRPFQNAAEMNEVITTNWNSVVKPGDRTFVLGDFAVGYKGTQEELEAFIDRLNGQKFLVRGNHERAADQLIRHKFGWVKDYHEYSGSGVKIVMFHYAQRIWNASHHGVYHLYGHSHGDLQELPYDLSFDCGVDSHNFTPWSIPEIKAKMEKKHAAWTEAGCPRKESSHHIGVNDVPIVGRR